jgi:S-methylmethionine-dependent homocysteine/selenocysteine methylase
MIFGRHVFCSNNLKLIRAVHLDYFNNGADIAITASYQATVEGFAKRGLSREQAFNLMQEVGATGAGSTR